MPVYVYQCKNCNHVFEQRQSFSDDALRICPQCGEETLRKRYNTVGVTSRVPASTAPTRATPKRGSTPAKRGRGEHRLPRPSAFKKHSPARRRYTILLPQCGGRCSTHPFQTLTLLRGQRLRGSGRLLGTGLLGVLLLSTGFLRGSTRGRRGTRSHHRRRRHTHQQRLSPAHRAAAAHATVTAARLRRDE